MERVVASGVVALWWIPVMAVMNARPRPPPDNSLLLFHITFTFLNFFSQSRESDRLKVLGNGRIALWWMPVMAVMNTRPRPPLLLFHNAFTFSHFFLTV